MYIYKVFGLMIQSELELPELIEAEGQTEIMIRIGKVPAFLQQPIIKTPWYEVEKDRFLHKVNGVASYYVENGTSITIEPENNASEELIRLFLLNSVLAPLLLQKGYLILQGSAVVINGKAVAMLGGTAMGKTSFALALHERGQQLITDGICAIKLVNSKLMIYQGIPQMNIWRDTLQAFNKNIGDYREVRQGLEKYVFDIKPCIAEDAVELAGIVVIRSYNANDILCEKIKGAKKIEELKTHSNYWDMVTDKAKLFQIQIAAGKLPMLRLSYNRFLKQLDKIAEVIEKEGM